MNRYTDRYTKMNGKIRPITQTNEGNYYGQHRVKAGSKIIEIYKDQ